MPCTMGASGSGDSVVASMIVPVPTPALVTRVSALLAEFTPPRFHGIIAP
jgi:hypothetical protein